MFPFVPGCSFTGPLLELLPVDRQNTGYTAVLQIPSFFPSNVRFFLKNTVKKENKMVQNPRTTPTENNQARAGIHMGLCLTSRTETLSVCQSLLYYYHVIISSYNMSI